MKEEELILSCRSLRILHIITALTVGGAQQLLLEMIPEIRDRGHDVSLIGLYPGPLRPEFEDRGIPVTELSLRGMVDPVTFSTLVREIRRIRPDVVHTHLGKADSYGRVAARLAGVPVVVTTVHNVEDWKEKPLLRTVDRWTSKLANRLLPCSRRVADHVLALKTVKATKVTTVQNGLSLKNWPRKTSVRVDGAGLRREFGLAPEDFVVGTVGRMEEQKGHRYLIDALGIVRASGCNVKLLFVGDGSLRRSLENDVAVAGLAGNVVFAGVRRDTKALFSIMDVFALPSLWEGLPIALLEAMAAYRTVVATDVGGVPEVIQDGDNGCIVPPADAAALAEAIQACYRDDGLAEALARRARETVEERFSLGQTVDQILAVYGEEITR